MYTGLSAQQGPLLAVAVQPWPDHRAVAFNG